MYFYPRPPRGGRHADLVPFAPVENISIHALREEGDKFSRSSFLVMLNFYPRPPRGGQRAVLAV